LLEVVGVVSDVKQFTLDREPTADLYVPLLQMPPSQAALLVARMYWVVRTRDDPRQLEAAVRNAVHSVDPEVATSSVRTLEALLQASLNPRRLNVRLLEYFGEVAVALSALACMRLRRFQWVPESASWRSDRLLAPAVARLRDWSSWKSCGRCSLACWSV
jgi:hypothetical protein